MSFIFTLAFHLNFLFFFEKLNYHCNEYFNKQASNRLPFELYALYFLKFRCLQQSLLFKITTSFNSGSYEFNYGSIAWCLSSYVNDKNNFSKIFNCGIFTAMIFTI